MSDIATVPVEIDEQQPSLGWHSASHTLTQSQFRNAWEIRLDEFVEIVNKAGLSIDRVNSIARAFLPQLTTRSFDSGTLRWTAKEHRDFENVSASLGINSTLSDADETGLDLTGLALYDNIMQEQEIKDKIRVYEIQYGMSSEEFLNKWREGTAPDTFETNDWAILLKYI